MSFFPSILWSSVCSGGSQAQLEGKRVDHHQRQGLRHHQWVPSFGLLGTAPHGTAQREAWLKLPSVRLSCRKTNDIIRWICSRGPNKCANVTAVASWFLCFWNDVIDRFRARFLFKPETYGANVSCYPEQMPSAANLCPAVPWRPCI